MSETVTSEAQVIAETITKQIGNGVLMSLGAHKLGHHTNDKGQSALVFLARVLPFNAAGKRLSTPRIMRAMVTLNVADTYDIQVDYRRGRQLVRHFQDSGIYADQLPHVLLGVDSDQDLFEAHMGHLNRTI